MAQTPQQFKSDKNPKKHNQIDIDNLSEKT